LPPGTTIQNLGAVVFACYGQGSCVVEKVSFVDVKGQRRQVEWDGPREIPAGEIWLTRLK